MRNTISFNRLRYITGSNKELKNGVSNTILLSSLHSWLNLYDDQHTLTIL